jgi:hypothetical protein
LRSLLVAALTVDLGALIWWPSRLAQSTPQHSPDSAGFAPAPPARAPLPQGRARRGRRRGRQDRHLPLGERYRRLVRRISKLKALVAIARSILVIVWHLLAHPTARFHDMGADYHAHRIDRTARPAPTSPSSRPSATPSP